MSGGNKSRDTYLIVDIWSWTSTPPRWRYKAALLWPFEPRTSNRMYTTSLRLDMYVPQSTLNRSDTDEEPGRPFLEGDKCPMNYYITQFPRLYSHFDQHGKGGISQLLSPTRRQVDLHLGPVPVQQLDLRRPVRGQRQHMQAGRVIWSRVVEDSGEPVILGRMNTWGAIRGIPV